MNHPRRILTSEKQGLLIVDCLLRRDKKNRILRSGESQTQDGRYKYTFYEGGKQRAFYSWKLEPMDRLPAGKRDCVALRDQIADYRSSTSAHFGYAVYNS
jgi:hypothetical protein